MAWDDPRALQVGFIQLFSNMKWFKNNGIRLSTQLQSIKNMKAVICSIFVLSVQKQEKERRKTLSLLYGSKGFSIQWYNFPFFPFLLFFVFKAPLFLAPFSSFYLK